MDTIPAKTIIQKCKNTSWFGTEYNMNIYKGCCHGCIYCDSRSECYRVDNFDTVRSKENALIIIRDELRRKVKSGIIGTGSMSDPYNPFEKEYQLTRHALELADAFEFGAVVLSKSALIARDIDIFQSIAEHSPMMAMMTVTTADDELCKKIEPNVSVPSERFETLAKMSQAGIFTTVAMMPLLPFINDSVENVLKIVRTAKECGARAVYPSFAVTLRTNQRDYFLEKLDEKFPESGLKEQYIQRFGTSYICRSPESRKLAASFCSECDKLGLAYKMTDIIRLYQLPYGERQLSFF